MNDFDVARWLEGLGLGEYGEVFRSNHIDADVLAELTDSDLEKIGVQSLGHRKKLLAEIRRLGSEPITAPAREAAPEEKAAPAVAELKREEPPTPIPEATRAPAQSAPQIAPALPPPPAVSSRPEEGSISFANKEPARADTSPASQTSPPPDKTPAHADNAPPRRTFWARILASKFLVGSIVAHVLFGMGATYFIVQRYSEKRKVTFQGGPPSVTKSTRALEHKISMAQKKKTGGAPPQAKRIATTGLSALALPEMPATSTADTVVPGMTAGMGGAGFGMGMGFGSGMGGGGGGGGGMTMFGFRGGGVGLVGTFYDFKRDSSGHPTGLKNLDRPNYTAILRGFTNDSMWSPPDRFRHHASSAKLGAKAFLIPVMPDSEAGKAFQDSKAGAGMWVAHYSGTVTPSVSGEYRFVAYSDNVVIIGMNGKVQLDASDIGYLGRPRTQIGAVTFPPHGAKPMYEGAWFQLTAGSSFKMDVLLGDEGGEFGGALFLQKKGSDYGRGKYGLPQLPLVLFAPLTEADKALYRKYVGDVAFSGPVFSVRGGGGSLLDALRR